MALAPKSASLDFSSVVVSEYPYLTALRSRYLFEVFDVQQKLAQQLELVSQEGDQATFRAAGARHFSLVSRRLTPLPEPNEATVRFLHKLAPIARDLGIHMNMET